MNANYAVLLGFSWMFLFTHCENPKTEKENPPWVQQTYFFDSSKISIIAFDSVQFSHLNFKGKTELSNIDLYKIELLLNRCNDDYNADEKNKKILIMSFNLLI